MIITFLTRRRVLQSRPINSCTRSLPCLRPDCCRRVCNGAANLGLGKVLGDGWRSVGAVISDIYCAAIGQEAAACPTIGETVAAWYEGAKTSAGNKLLGLEEINDSGADTLPPVNDNGNNDAGGGEDVNIEPTVIVAPVVIPQGLIDAVAQATANWQATWDMAAARNAMELIAAQYPNEVNGYQAYATLKGKVDAFDKVFKALISTQNALTEGQIADPQEFVNAVKAYKTACSDYAAATSDLNPNPWQSVIDNCTQNSTALVNLITAYVNATADGADPAKFAETVTPAWHTTSWRITEYDDRVGSCRCATITALTPNLIDGLVLSDIPTEALKDLFPDATGLGTTEVGQEITWP